MDNLIELAIIIGVIWNVLSKFLKAKARKPAEPPPLPPGVNPFPEFDDEGDFDRENLTDWPPEIPAPQRVPMYRPDLIPEAPISVTKRAAPVPTSIPAPAPCPAKRVLGARPDLQQAVVWSEILAPPLALRPGRDT